MRKTLLLLLLGAGGFMTWQALAPYQGFSGEQFVDIPHGTTTEGVAALLAKAGVVRSRPAFLAARAAGRWRKLQAGEYRFARPASAIEVFNRIARGDVYYVELVVPEGKNMFDIAALAEQTGLIKGEQFLAAARDPAMIRDLDPQAPTLEGYLFPDTYRLNRKSTAEKLCRTMTGKFREAWSGLNTDAGAHRTVTLASMVEKESKVPQDRPLVSAVFTNRLRMGMKLDCDPTTIYAAVLDGRYRGTIYRSDLNSQHAYNTYQHAGLPPGPIANPGIRSMEAALHPADSKALYFVLRPDGSGAHQFSENIADQNAAAARYRHAQH